MGNTFYSCDTRALRAAAQCYDTAPVHKTFIQTNLGRVHESMDSSKVIFREARDSENHPRSLPIILALDVTGSMGMIPRQLIASGLPTLMGKITQTGCPDAALCFLAIGDHECDRYPVQVAQFESGDAELDMWLTRTYLEGGGGGNRGESYPLAWEFAANRVESDAWDKRKEKGFLFTIGDEPFLKNFPARAFSEIYGSNRLNPLHQDTLTAEELYEAACEKFHVFHISLEHSYRKTDPMWKELLGDRCIILDDYNDVPMTIANMILENAPNNQKAKVKKESSKVTVPDVKTDDTNEML